MTQGRPPLFTDMRIVNDGGQELPWDGGAAGELQVRGPHVIRAYFKVSFPPLRRFKIHECDIIDVINTNDQSC